MALNSYCHLAVGVSQLQYYSYGRIQSLPPCRWCVSGGMLGARLHPCIDMSAHAGVCLQADTQVQIQECVPTYIHVYASRFNCMMEGTLAVALLGCVARTVESVRVDKAAYPVIHTHACTRTQTHAHMRTADVWMRT